MAKPKKLIPCRVCGKMFEPCSYCQIHSDVFRWRNFACSIECAKKYVASTEAYRDAQREKAKYAESKASEETTPKKRGRKKTEPKVEEIVETDEIVEKVPDIAEDIGVDDSEQTFDIAEDTDGLVDDEIATDTEIEEK